METKTINLGGVNCYLIKTDRGYILIDTGGRVFSNGNLSSIRAILEKELTQAGCLPGNLRLVILTHGHFDHSDNCAYLREKYHTPIAMHQSDSSMVENGILPNRKFRPLYMKFMAMIMMFFFKSRIKEISGNFEKFKPDFYIDEGFDLAEYGFHARVLHLPGHSAGSIGILTPNGDLFAGDILGNFRDRPGFAWQMADNNFADLDLSILRLRNENLINIYPGHGKPFPMTRLRKIKR